MGVKGLYTYLKPYRHDIYPQTTPVADSPLRIGFDGMSMLYKYKSQYAQMYPLLAALVSQGHKLLFVFDGKSPAEKADEVRERREAREEATAQAAALKEHLISGGALTMPNERKILEYSIARLEHQGWHMTREIRHSFQDALRAVGIPCIKAAGEADDVLVDLAAAEKLDVIVSTDMDFLLSGVPRLWIPFRKIADGFEEVSLWEILEGEGLSPAAFTDAGILCGVEPLRGQVSVQTQTAFSWLRYYQSIEALLASNVREPQLDVLREENRLTAVRAHFKPQQPWSARIRPDHLEKEAAFLNSL